VILPFENEKDVDDIPKNIRSKMNFVFARNMDEVLAHSLVE